ncbi:hypothetical protein Nepgr_005393 [Nepenthes gracilis]|uniref:Uncharacterized protein n=1 Tax=Nepenthes gracilis TaxID=150966 RepID=A0AAD3XG99_NEPGR|nr:hypothetical protein Nepgr_005393 [Nepenthes gracilis]
MKLPMGFVCSPATAMQQLVCLVRQKMIPSCCWSAAEPEADGIDILGADGQFPLLFPRVWHADWHSVSLDSGWNGSWDHFVCCFIAYGDEDGVIVNCCAIARYLQRLYTELVHVGLFHENSAECFC